MNKQINLIDLVNIQKAERYKALLIIGNLHVMTPDIGKRLSNILKAYYINLVDEFIKDLELAAKIDTFDSDELKTFLRRKVNPNETVVLVDGLDMLWSIWSPFERKGFLKRVEKNTISPFPQIVLIFLCTKHDLLHNYSWFNDAYHLPRIVDINDILMGGKP